MTEIPDDIMQAARKLLNTLQWDIDSADADRERIALAILAERERCALTVERLALTMAGKITPDGFLLGPNAPNAFAAAIRGGSHE